MIRWICRSGSVLILVLLAGCAQFGTLTAQRPTPQHIAHLLAHQQYGQALAALQNIPAGTPDAATLRVMRLQAQAQAERYEQQQLEAAHREERAGNWRHAEKTLRDALGRYPGAPLRSALDTLHERRVRRIQEIDRDLLVAWGQWLNTALPAREELKRIAPFSLLDQLRIKQLEFERQNAAEGLTACGRDALRADHLSEASRCLTLAQQLQDTPAVRQALGQLAEKSADRARQEALEKQRSLEEALRRRQADLRNLVQDAIANGEWQQARVSLTKLMALDKGNQELARLKRALDEAVAVRIQQLLDQGNMLYREGKIQKAKDVWDAVLALDPEQQQARANVQRAQRVLNKLRELQEQSAKPAPPTPSSAPPPVH
ncbi:MAG: hypothetical protein B7Z66_00720 [Chromatiales bacterium 21-64-14]|nr:MAG: hypothetical protein B7Z66_00720 [Chromatiales bacterium 21-64-14]HQU15554.1 hypothetical protein [Gammaproteobacteria bacterium]